jgi:hypothetical protein
MSQPQERNKCQGRDEMEVPMSLEICVECGIAFAIPEDFQIELENCHNTFYCPNGHSQNYLPYKKIKEEKKEKKKIS